MMTIDSLPAIPATPSANVAPLDAKSATDGSQLHTDAEGGEIAAFAAIFQQLSQANSAREESPPQPPQAQASTTPILPNLPPAVLNVELPDEPVTDVEDSDPLELKEKPQRPISIK